MQARPDRVEQLADESDPIPPTGGHRPLRDGGSISTVLIL